MDPGPAEVTLLRNTTSRPSVSESAFYVGWRVVTNSQNSAAALQRQLGALKAQRLCWTQQRSLDAESGLGANSSAKLRQAPVQPG